MKKLIKKLLYKHRFSSDTYIDYLRKKGVEIGEDCTIYSPKNTIIDEQYPWMITIGDHVRITEGVIILTHDYSWSVLKRLNLKNQSGAILGASGKVNIGNNVFIGMNTVILRNVNIGNDVIIGAGSIVSKDCESGWVYAGNPAKKIMPVSEFYKKRKEKQLEEARELAVQYRNRFGEYPTKEIFHEYFMLFCNENELNDTYKKKMNLCNNYNDSINYLSNNEPMFKNFDEFINYCFSCES